VLTFPGVIRLKAVLVDEMVGFVSGDPRPSERMGWITTIGVLPRFRRRGIATALLLEAERQMKMPRVRLSVRRSNVEAIHLYVQHGYRQVSVWARYYAGGEDGLIFEKQLGT